MVLMLLGLLLGCLMSPMSGLMAALFWIRSQVYPPPVLGSTLISLRIAGVNVGGVVLIVFVQMVRFRLAGVFVLSLGLLSQFRGPKCGGVILALQSSDAVRLGLTIWVWFGILVVY